MDNQFTSPCIPPVSRCVQARWKCYKTVFRRRRYCSKSSYVFPLCQVFPGWSSLGDQGYEPTQRACKIIFAKVGSGLTHIFLASLIFWTNINTCEARSTWLILLQLKWWRKTVFYDINTRWRTLTAASAWRGWIGLYRRRRRRRSLAREPRKPENH